MAPTPTSDPTSGRAVPRWVWRAGAGGAGAIALVFATIGDGVPASTDTGWRGWVVDHAHTAVWVLLLLAFLSAAVAGGWRRPASLLAGAAAVLYVVFLVALLAAG